MQIKSSAGVFAVLVAAQMQFAQLAFGNAIRFDFGEPATSAVGDSIPMMSALFDDVGPNQVELTITANGLAGSDSGRAFYFNFNPAYDASELVFDQAGSVGGVQGSVSTGVNSIKTGGGGKFDIMLGIGQSPAFVSGDSLTYMITGPMNFSVEDFMFQDTAAAGVSPTYAASSIQQLSGVVVLNGNPTAVSVPDATSTAGLFGLALVALVLVFRRARRESGAFSPAFNPARSRGGTGRSRQDTR